LLDLLERLVRLKHGDPTVVQERSERQSSVGVSGFDGPEHRDIVVLYNAGYIASPRFMGGNPANRWSPEGIYAYEITDDGLEYLQDNWHIIRGDPSPDPSARPTPAEVFIIHGTDPNGYVPQVEDVCRKFGLDPIRMMEQPNRGLGLPDKLRENMGVSDYYVAVLTHDETITDGQQRARQNAIAETVTANQNWPGRLAILREGQVEIPSNLQGLGYIPLEGQWSARLLQEFRAAGLIYPDERRHHLERDHSHRNSGGNIVIGKPSADGKPAVGDICHGRWPRRRGRGRLAMGRDAMGQLPG
jgi:hypothetical protein